MLVFYRIIVGLYGLVIRVISPWNKKASLWVAGRKSWRSELQSTINNFNQRPVWFHASSVGEFEQGRPIIEQLRQNYPDLPIVLTFFSPSGYELYKDLKLVDRVLYLPIDSPSNSRDFVSILNPRLAIFVKYEFWYFYFKELRSASIPFALVSAKLTPSHLFFKWYGKWYRRVLAFPNHYFVQDESTADLLEGIGISNFSVCGDTRIDRVNQIRQMEAPTIIEKFKNGELLVIGGSTWKTENQYLLEWFGGKENAPKLIVAPHEINEDRILKLVKRYGDSVIRYTQISDENEVQKARVLILDTVGLLSRLYRYADLAFIGGGFRDGIHNILEPAVFGTPVLFGPNHHKFHEAHDLIERGGAVSVDSYDSFKTQLELWLNNDQLRIQASDVCKTYVSENLGATQQILERIDEWMVD